MENEVKVEENVTSQPVQPQEVVQPVEQPKTKRKGRGPLYWIIVIIGVGLIVYLSMGIGEKLGRLAELESGDSKTDTKEESNSNNESNITTEPETTKDEEIENFNAATVTNTLNTELGEIVNWSNIESGKNIFDNESNRLIWAAAYVEKYDETDEERDNMQGGIRYTDVATFDKAFKLVFGDNYTNTAKPETDPELVTVMGENKISWLISGVPSDMTLTATKIEYDENNSLYVISGTYTNEDEGGNKTAGNFTLSYNKKDGSRYLKSMIFTQTN